MIHVDYRDARPIYEQIQDGLRRLMVAGALRPWDRLPSVRTLAASLAINPNTIQRAYETLEAEGYVRAVAGKGRFAAPREGIDHTRREQMIHCFDQAAAELLFLGLSAEELSHRVQTLADGREEGMP